MEDCFVVATIGGVTFTSWAMDARSAILLVARLNSMAVVADPTIIPGSELEEKLTPPQGRKAISVGIQESARAMNDLILQECGVER